MQKSKKPKGILAIPYEIRRYIYNEKQNDALRRERYSPRKYAAYRKKKQRQYRKMGIAAALILLVLILLLVGLFNLIGFIAGKLTSKPQKTDSAAPISTEVSAPEAATPTATEAPELQIKNITLGSTGSIFLHGDNLKSAQKSDGTYDFSEPFQYITPYYSGVDFMTLTFEGSNAGPEQVYQGYPTFNSPDEISDAIMGSGVDLVMLASNHIFDGLSPGFHRTMDVYDQRGYAYTGIRQSTDIDPYYVADVDGVKVGVIDYLFRDRDSGDSVLINWIELEEGDRPLINTFDYSYLDTFYGEINSYIYDLKTQGAQFIVANMHWGEEYDLVQSYEQENIAAELAELGVDAIIGGHPHVIQPIDVIEASNGHKMFVIYSEGNLLCNQRRDLISNMPDGHTEDGVFVELQLEQDESGDVSIIGVDAIPTWTYKYYDNNGGVHYSILPLDDIPNLESMTGFSGIQSEALASYNRTMDIIGEGLTKAQAAFSENFE